MEKSALMPIVQTVVPEEPILKANETVTAYTLFDKAIRIGSVDARFSDFYVLFSPDGKLAHLYSDAGKKHETLQRQSLPKGGYVWNVEDDDTKNLRHKDGVWTIEKRMQLIASQSKSDVDASLGRGKRNTSKACCLQLPAPASAISSRCATALIAATARITLR